MWYSLNLFDPRALFSPKLLMKCYFGLQSLCKILIYAFLYYLKIDNTDIFQINVFSPNVLQSLRSEYSILLGYLQIKVPQIPQTQYFFKASVTPKTKSEMFFFLCSFNTVFFFHNLSSAQVSNLLQFYFPCQTVRTQVQGLGLFYILFSRIWNIIGDQEMFSLEFNLKYENSGKKYYYWRFLENNVSFFPYVFKLRFTDGFDALKT